MDYLLAEANIGYMHAPMADPSMIDLAVRMGDLHRLAERSPGFVWRTRGEDLTPDDLLHFADVAPSFDPARLFLTMSLWRDLDALHAFVYATVHLDVLRQKRRWMADLGRPSVVLWWTPSGRRPSVPEAATRLRALRDCGPARSHFTFPTRFPPPDVRVDVASPQSADAASLIEALDVEIARRYPGVVIHGLQPADLGSSQVTFLVARVDGDAVGCGALRVREPGVAEVKRMFVRPAYRGLGLARALLAALETRAGEIGAARVVLETGSGQPEAIELYRSCGYVDIPRYGEYVDIGASRCFEKRLRAPMDGGPADG